jgi:hypothetical protein
MSSRAGLGWSLITALADAGGWPHAHADRPHLRRSGWRPGTPADRVEHFGSAHVLLEILDH